MSYRKTSLAFTLIELLIVVAIIAILAAIAVPNFLEAQVRSKVSRCKADMRSIATALEAYRTDGSHYPPDRYYYTWLRVPQMSSTDADNLLLLHVLSTPVAYMTSVPDTPFKNRQYGYAGYISKPIENWYIYYGEYWKQAMIDYFATVRAGLILDRGPVWSLSSVGPDQQQNQGPYLIFGQQALESPEVVFLGQIGCVYDATNGTMSAGDIVRIGP